MAEKKQFILKPKTKSLHKKKTFPHQNSLKTSGKSHFYQCKNQENALFFPPKHVQKRQQLPIFPFKSDIINSVEKHQISIIVGETGSGKTTQIPQYIHEYFQQQKRIKKKSKKPQPVNVVKKANEPNWRKIAITQPRRVAAATVAGRVAEEVGCLLGSTVGYCVRFDDTTSKATKLKFMTDGMLVREALLSPTFESYSVIILDEAHERTLQTDILFGIIKRALAIRKDLKVVVMSATLDIALFEGFFSSFDTNVLKIPGRQFPVEMYYTEEPQQDYLDAALKTIFQVHLSKSSDDGHILVFLTGQEDIETLQQLLEEYSKRLPLDSLKLLVYPIYAALPREEQMKVFSPVDTSVARKVILATNIAETSITINGVSYVIDTGLSKQKSYVPRNGTEILRIEPISQAQSWQRSGRAGRERPGTCFRLFPEEKFEELSVRSMPEIRRMNLEVVALQLKVMGIDDILSFEFIEKPNRKTLIKALERLYALKAFDSKGNLTEKGRQMAALPIPPMFSAMVLKATELGCADEAISIVSMLSVESIFFSPKDKKEKSVEARRRFNVFEGDHLTLLNIFQQYRECPLKEKVLWCNQHFINHRAMKKVTDIRQQLLDNLKRLNLPIASSSPDYDPILKSLVAGFFLNVAMRTSSFTEISNASRQRHNGSFYGGKSVFVTMGSGKAGSEPVKIHPSGVLFQRNPAPKWIIFNELVFTSQNYIRGVSIIQKEWLLEIAPEFFSKLNHTTEIQR